MAIVKTIVKIQSTNETFEIQRNYDPTQIQSAYASDIAGIGTMEVASDTTALIAGGGGDEARTIVFRQRVGNKG